MAAIVFFQALALKIWRGSCCLQTINFSFWTLRGALLIQQLVWEVCFELFEQLGKLKGQTRKLKRTKLQDKHAPYYNNIDRIMKSGLVIVLFALEPNHRFCQMALEDLQSQHWLLCSYSLVIQSNLSSRTILEIKFSSIPK